jgi:hypothetical protein
VLFYVPIAAGIVLLMLAAALLRAQSGHDARRAFSLVLFPRGLALIALGVTFTAPTIPIARLGALLYPVFCLATVVGIINFLAAYPAPRSWLSPGRRRAFVFGSFGLLALTAAFWPSLILLPGLPASPDTLDMVAWLRGSALTPFGLGPTLLDLTFAIPAVVLVRDCLKTRSGKRRDTLLVVSLGFFAPAACSCLIAGALLQMRSTMPRPPEPGVFNYIEMGLFVVWFVVLGGLLAYLTIRALRTRDSRTRREASLYGLVLLISTALGAATSKIPTLEGAIQGISAMVGFWSVIGAATVTYGVLRSGLFDIDAKLKISMSRSSVAAVFVAVYFLVSEGATVWFSGIAGSDYWGIIAAAALLLALQPIRTTAERIVERLMPGTRPLASLSRDEAAHFYREHVDLMWMDGRLSPKDRIVLAKLREQLGLDPAAAEEIELAVLEQQPA